MMILNENKKLTKISYCLFVIGVRYLFAALVLFTNNQSFGAC